MIKCLFLYFLILLSFITSAYKTIPTYVINAEKDAYFHNNVGLNYLKDRIYYAAIQEFKIAIQLSPNTQATAIFKSNLGETYLFIGYPDMAQVCFEDSIKLYPLNFKNYLNLVKCYKEQNILQQELNKIQKSDKLYDRILKGLIYIELKEFRAGINILDEVTFDEPDILITPAIKQYLKDITEN